MKIIIIGAGMLGQALARRLDSEENDITIIDSSEESFQLIHDKMDVMTVHGQGANVTVMKKAGISHADLLIAVSSDQASNMLACQIAKHFGVPQCICRIYSQDAFSAEDGFTPEFFGITDSFSAYAESVDHITNVLQKQMLREIVEFSNQDATLATLVIPENSPIKGVKLEDIPDHDLVANIRVAARIRNHVITFPRGKNTLNGGDIVYVAGRKEYVAKFMNYVNGQAKEKSRKLVVIGGGNVLSQHLGNALIQCGMEVRYVEPDEEVAEKLLDNLKAGVRVVHGAVTDIDALAEAGIADCDVFVSTSEDDEIGILSGILAKREGAKKVAVITHRPEYAGIVQAVEFIDCGFNSTVIAANTIFRMMARGTIRIDTRLFAYNAHIAEFQVRADSRCVGKLLKECKVPMESVLAMLFRNGEVLVPNGDTKFMHGDVVVAIVTSSSEAELKGLF